MKKRTTLKLSRNTIRVLTKPSSVVGGNLPIPGPPRSFGGEDSCFGCGGGDPYETAVTCTTCNC
jgi:hypothetical protein